MALLQQSLAASGQIALGAASPTEGIASYVVQLSGTWVGNVLPKGRLFARNPANTGTNLATTERKNIGYKTFVSATLVDPGTTPITANGIYVIPADGLFVELDWTRTSGTLLVDIAPLRG